MDHDQAFKNLVQHYPREALEFFAPGEAGRLPLDVQITPFREETPADRLGDPDRFLDMPLVVTYPDGTRETVVFVLEGESTGSKFSPARLASYCADLSRATGSTRVVPVVVCLRGDLVESPWRLATEKAVWLELRWISCVLPQLPFERYMRDENIVARVCLVNMDRTDEVERRVVLSALMAIQSKERDGDRCAILLDYVNAYSRLGRAETRQLMREARMQVPSEAMKGFWDFKEEIRAEGRIEGRGEGRVEGFVEGRAEGRVEALQSVLLRMLRSRGLSPSSDYQARILAVTDPAQLEDMIDRILQRQEPAEIFG